MKHSDLTVEQALLLDLYFQFVSESSHDFFISWELREYLTNAGILQGPADVGAHPIKTILEDDHA